MVRMRELSATAGTDDRRVCMVNVPWAASPWLLLFRLLELGVRELTERNRPYAASEERKY
jgi:hypothetical protein